MSECSSSLRGRGGGEGSQEERDACIEKASVRVASEKWSCLKVGGILLNVTDVLNGYFMITW